MFARPLKRLSAGRGFLRPALCAALTLGGVWCVPLEGCQRPASLPPSRLAVSSSAPAAAETAKTDANAAEWERSVRAGDTVPLRARVVVSRWADKDGAKEARTEMEVAADGAGRYRHVYILPGGKAGRVVLSDSRTNYQYEPTRNVVLKRPEIASEPAEIVSPAHLSHTVAPEPVSLLGRPTRLILTNTTRENRSVYLSEKRWADAATGRSLKTETYAPSGRLVRRFEITRVSFPAAIGQEIFRPNFPAAARTIAATTPRLKSAFAEAARLGLPREAHGFRLQSVARSAKTGAQPATHLIYSDGTRTISLFVAEPGGVPAPTPPPTPEWRSLTLAPGVPAYARYSRENADTLLVWIKNNRRYTAVSQLPLEDWLPAARAFAE